MAGSQVRGERFRISSREMQEMHPLSFSNSDAQDNCGMSHQDIQNFLGDDPIDGHVPWYKRGLATFSIKFLGWLWQSCLLGHNIYLAIFDEDGFWDVGLTIGLHVFSCLLLVGFEYSNLLMAPGGFPKFARKPFFIMFKFICDLLTLWKPIWNYKIYRESQDTHRAIWDRIQLEQMLTIQQLKGLVEIKKKLLEKSHYKLVHIFVKEVPMALLQIYFLPQQNVANLKLCSMEEWNRLALILTCIYSSAVSTTEYATSYSVYLKHQHFLHNCIARKKFQDFPRPSFISTIFHFLCHLILSAHRFHAIIYCRLLSPYLAITFILTIFLSHWILLEIFPVLRMRLDNPPHGVPTFFSNLIDRWVNVFNGHMIRITTSRLNICQLKRLRLSIPIWTGLLQIIPFLLSLSMIHLVNNFLPQIDNLVTTPIAVPNSNSIDTNTIFKSQLSPSQENSCLHDTVFNYFNFSSNLNLNLNLRVPTKISCSEEFFWSQHFLGILLVVYMTLCGLLTIYLNFTGYHRHVDLFPVQVAYNFLRPLLDLRDPCGGQQRDWTCKIQASRFMALVLMEEQEFQKVLWHWRISCGRESGSLKRFWRQLILDLSLGEREKTFGEIQRGFSSHPLRYEMESFRVDCMSLSGSSQVDYEFVKLVSRFYREFDDKVMMLSSYRIQKMFLILGIKVQARVED